MGFGPIVFETETYEQRQPGIYVLNSITFGSPSREFRLRPGAKGKDGLIRGSGSYIWQEDVTVGGETSRLNHIVTVNYTTTPKGTNITSKLDGALLRLSTFYTEQTISRQLQGES